MDQGPLFDLVPEDQDKGFALFMEMHAIASGYPRAIVSDALVHMLVNGTLKPGNSIEDAEAWIADIADRTTAIVRKQWPSILAHMRKGAS